MARTPVSAEQLLDIVNESLRKALKLDRDRDTILITGVYKVDEPDASGCNWTPGFYQHVSIDKTAFDRVIEQLQEEYNLAD